MAKRKHRMFGIRMELSNYSRKENINDPILGEKKISRIELLNSDKSIKALEIRLKPKDYEDLDKTRKSLGEIASSLENPLEILVVSQPVAHTYSIDAALANSANIKFTIESLNSLAKTLSPESIALSLCFPHAKDRHFFFKYRVDELIKQRERAVRATGYYLESILSWDETNNLLGMNGSILMKNNAGYGKYGKELGFGTEDAYELSDITMADMLSHTEHRMESIKFSLDIGSICAAVNYYKEFPRMPEMNFDNKFSKVNLKEGRQLSHEILKLEYCDVPRFYKDGHLYEWFNNLNDYLGEVVIGDTAVPHAGSEPGVLDSEQLDARTVIRRTPSKIPIMIGRHGSDKSLDGDLRNLRYLQKITKN